MLWALLLAVGYMVAEAVGGWWSGSLALLADAGHMLSDAAALALSLIAAWIVTREGSSQQTFGFLRVEILAAVVNGVLLIVVSLGIIWEAWERFRDPQPIAAGWMSLIAFGGLIVNLAILRLLHATDHGNLNMRGAWLHALGDTLGSVGVLIAGGLAALGWESADPCVSLLISLLIIYSSYRLLSDAIAVLLEQSPASIDVAAVRTCLESADGVAGVHCLHVWSLSSSIQSITAHVTLKPDQQVRDTLPALQQRLQDRFAVRHITLQLEPHGCTPCGEAPPGDCLATPDDGHACGHNHADHA